MSSTRSGSERPEITWTLDCFGQFLAIDEVAIEQDLEFFCVSHRIATGVVANMGFALGGKAHASRMPGLHTPSTVELVGHAAYQLTGHRLAIKVQNSRYRIHCRVQRHPEGGLARIFAVRTRRVRNRQHLYYA